MAFLTFYTPTYKRPGLLAGCVASLEAQTDRDYQHLIIYDDTGIGIPGVFAAVKEHCADIRGRYVYFLQDDDYITDPDLVRELKRCAEANAYPPVIIVKNRKNGVVYPTRWKQEPKLGTIDLGSYIVRSDVFMTHAGDFGRRYEGDFDFIRALWLCGYEFHWWDRLIANARQVGRGKAEA